MQRNNKTSIKNKTNRDEIKRVKQSKDLEKVEDSTHRINSI